MQNIVAFGRRARSLLRLLRKTDPAGLTAPFGGLGDLLVAPAARWDATWYLAIASGGYDDATRTAFFFRSHPTDISQEGSYGNYGVVRSMLRAVIWSNSF